MSVIVSTDGIPGGRGRFRDAVVRAGSVVVSGCLSLALAVLPAQGDNIWDGGGDDSNWNTATNWDSNVVPSFPVALTFAGNTRLVNTNNLTGVTVNGFLFDAAAGAFTLRGNAVTLGGDIGFSANPAASVTQTVGMNMALTGERVLTSQARGNLALTGILSGSGGLRNAGLGTNTLSGVNTFTGGVTLDSGVLKATTSASSLGTGASTLRINGGTLHLANDANLSYNRNTVVSNSATLVPDNLAPAGNNRTHTLGTLSIGSQTLTVAKGTNITGTSYGQVTFGSTTLTGDPVFTILPYSYLQLGAISESVAGTKVTVSGSGTNPLLILNGTGSWTGGTEVNGTAFVRASAANSLGEVGSATTMNGSGGTLELRNANSAVGRHVAFKGNTTLNLKNNSSTAFGFGSFAIDPGLTVKVDVNRVDANTGNSHTLAGPVTTSGNAQLDVTGGNSFKAVLSGGITMGGTLTVNPTTAPLTISGAISDGAESYSLVKIGTGLLSLSGANAYDGGTTVSAGRLLIGAREAAPHDRPLFLDGGIYDLGGLTLTNSAFTMLAGALTNGTLVAPSYLLAGGVVASDATLAGSGSLTNAGGVTTVLGGASYEGNTMVEGGVLSIATTSQLPGWDTAGRYSVLSGAGLAVGNAVTDGNVATILGTGNFAAGAGFGFDTTAGDRTYPATLADTGAGSLGLVKVGANTLSLAAGNTYSGGTAILGGALSVADDSALGAAGGGLMISNSASFRFGGDFTLNNRSVLVRSGGYIVGEPGRTLTVTNDVTVASGTLNITGACTVVLGGSNTYAGHVYLNNSRLSLLPGSVNTINGMDLRPAGVAGTTGAVQQVGGLVSITGGGAGLCLGSNGGVGEYTLDGGGVLEALTTGSRGIILGVNHFSTGTYHLVSGVVTGNMLQVSRSDAVGTNAAGFYYQRSGSSTFASLHMAGGTAANSANNYALLAVSNGTFSATTFSGLAGGNNSTGVLYFGNGTLVTLGAFPATRGTSAYAGLTMDGSTLIPAAASTTYMRNLTEALITDNGATFDVPAGKNITVAQPLQDAPGASGDLTKAGNGVLTLTATNTYSGITAVRAGVLSVPSTLSLPGWNASGRFAVSNGAALAVGNAMLDADVVALLGTGNFAAGSSFGFDTSAGNRTYATALADLPGGAMGLVKFGANKLTLTAANTYSGWTIVYGNNGVGLELNSLAGPALQGGLQIGAPGDTSGNVYVKTLAPDQFGPSSQLFLNRGIGVNSTPILELLGNNQTVAGLLSDTAAGATYIENTQAETGYAGAILTVSNSVDNSYGSYIRNAGTGGSGTIGLTKDGEAVLTLSGGNIVYTGPTLVKAGTLVLSNTTGFASVPTVSGGRLLLATATALNSKSLTNLVDNGLGFVAGTDFTVGGLSGTGGISLTNEWGEAVVLTLGAGGANGSYSGSFSGTGSVIKVGLGAQTLSEASTLIGPFVLGNGTSNMSSNDTASASSGGFVVVGHDQALGAGVIEAKGAQVWAEKGGLTIPNDIVVTNSGGFRFGGAYDLTLSGDVAIDGIRGFGNYSLDKTLTLSGAISVPAGSSFLFDGFNGAPTNGTIIVSGSISGEGNVTVADSFDNGKAVLTGVNTYSGTTTINTGKLLALEGLGTITNSGMIVVEEFATLDVSGRSSAFELTASQTLRGKGTLAGDAALAGSLLPADAGMRGTFTISGDASFAGGATVIFDLTSLAGAGGGTNDLLVIGGDLAAGGTLVLNVTEPLDTAGTYRLIEYGGSLSGSFAVSVNGRYTATLDTGTSGQINVTFAETPTKDLVWKGVAGYATWDQGTSTNWSDGGPTWTSFLALDDVTFDGTAEDNSAQISGFVSPASVAVSGANDVTLSGTGEISGSAALSKTGGGTLTISTANSYAGGTTVSEGRLRVGSNSAVGTGLLTLAGGTALSSADAATARTISAPYTLAGDVTLGDAADSASLTLSGATTLTANRELTVASDVTLGGVISESGGSRSLTKKGSGNLILNKANTFSGSSTVEAGTLTVAAVAAPATTLDLPLLTVKSNATAVATGAGSALGDTMDVAVEAGGSLNVEKNDVMGGLSGAGTLRGTHALSVYTLTVNNGNETTEFSGNVTYADVPINIAKNGSGTLTLSGANDYLATTVNNGILRVASATALPAGGPLTLGDNSSTTAGTLDLTSYSATVGSFNVSSTNFVATNRLVIAAGQTLSVTGNVTIGHAAINAKTTLTAQGGGSLLVANPGGSFRLGVQNSGSDRPCQVAADFSALSLLDVSLGTGSFTLGASGDNGVYDRCIHTLTLAPASYIRAATVTAGGSALGSSHLFRLGADTNVIFANAFNIGANGRDCGKVLFAGPTGSLTLRDAAGTGRANMNIGTNANTVNTGYTATNIFDVTGHDADLLIGTLRIGSYPMRTTAWRNWFFFNRGRLDVGDVVMNALCNAGKNGASTLAIGGGEASFASISLSSSIATGVVSITGGTVTMGGDIIKQGSGVGWLSLSGGTLDMQGNEIGSAAAKLNLAMMSGGTLANLAGFNGGDPLVKTGTGTLCIAGVNTYSSTNRVTGGTLLVNGSLSAQSPVIVTNAALGGTGTIGGSAWLAPKSRLLIGGTNVTANILTVSGDLSMAAGVTNVLDLTATTNSSVSVAGNLTLQGASVIHLNLAGGEPPQQTTVFTFGTVTGEEYLDGWTVTGVDPGLYKMRVVRIDSRIVLLISRRGTLMFLL